MEQLRMPERQRRISALLEALATRPPQALLLEGGDDAERAALARYWAATLNCDTRRGGPPCLECAACRQIAADTFRDLLFLDGRVESIKVDMVREVRALMGEPPRGDGTRVVVLAEAQNMVADAANGLLKSMEEPRPGNVFVLTVPQREQLLPTLVSRSFCLTLAWPPTLEQAAAQASDTPEAREWAAALVTFWATGRGWFGRTAGAGKLDALTAGRALTACRRLLGLALAGEAAGPAADLARMLTPEGLGRLAAALEQAEEALEFKANPTLVLDWLAATTRTWVRG